MLSGKKVNRGQALLCDGQRAEVGRSGFVSGWIMLRVTELALTRKNRVRDGFQFVRTKWASDPDYPDVSVRNLCLLDSRFRGNDV